MLKKLLTNAATPLIVTLFTFIVLASFLIASSYKQQLSLAQNRELSRLKGIVSTLSLQIDGDMHHALIVEYEAMDAIDRNDQDRRYESIHLLLKKAQDANMIESTIYTMVYSRDMDKFCFGVTSSDEPFWKHPYKGYPQELRENYTKGGTVEMYEDEHGMWLSAFQPVKDREGNTVAILQVDQRFEQFLEETRTLVIGNIATPLLISSVVAIILFLFLRNILRQRQKLDAERAELENLRQELIANVSHDLRTPLASIQGYLETVLMKRHKLEDNKLEKYLATSLKNTEKLRSLVDDLFAYSKLESRSQKPKMEPFSLAELANDVVNSMTVNAKAKSIHVKSEIAHDTPLCLGDISMIDRVIQNLISNAIKFSESEDTISVHVKSEGEYIVCTVSDTGAGIAEDELEKVFNRFHTKSAGNSEGTGLGLAIVKSVLEAHEAEYNIQSELHKGTSFTFCLRSFKG